MEKMGKLLNRLFNEFGGDSVKVRISAEKARSDIEAVLNDCSSDGSNLSFHDIDTFNGRACVFRIYGGLNGHGEWYVYLEDLSKFMRELIQRYQSASVISLTPDPIDDLFEATISVKF